jgi:hypothetical protein
MVPFFILSCYKTSINTGLIMTKLKKFFISVFIVLNLLAMIRVHIPLNTKFFSMVYRPVDSYLSFFSIYQDWMMFAPDPGRLNTNVRAEVEFDDGTKESYTFPKESSYLGKYISGEKYRKFVSEGIRKDSHRFLWRDSAKFVLRQLKNENYNKIPLKVYLIREWDEIPDMDKKFRLHSDKAQTTNSSLFYTYEVI